MSHSLALLILLLGCHGTDDKSPSTDDSQPSGDSGDSGVADEPDCAEAAARLGLDACVPRVADEDTFEAITVAASTVDQLRAGKFLVPARADARVPPVFLYVGNFPLHYDFLVAAFPDDFAGLSTDDYQTLTLYPETREFYAGTLSLYTGSSGFYYGFTVWDDPADETSTITEDDVTAAWEILQDRFEIGELSWVPNTANQTEAAQGWVDAPFPIAGLESEVAYEAYNVGEAYGTLQLYTLDELATASENAEFSYQSILALEQAPTDLERVVSGLVTGSRQGELSHLSVRSAARGTPNCYIADPMTALAEWEGQLVRLECGEDTWSVEAASAEDAEAWWASIRPDPLPLCAPLTDEAGLPGLLDLPTDTVEERQANVCTFGSKGSNLAALYQRIDDAYTFDGFLIPMHYYKEFVDTTTWMVDLGDGEAEHTFSETLDVWHADPAFLSDAALRRERLDDLHDAMQDAHLDDAVVDLLASRILEVYGSDEVMVRFRSSSNAEDSLEFSGAGLYESESGCLADELDGDEEGPSRCDPDMEEEQTLRHALQEVWASLWLMQAWDERDWYGMDQSMAAMGVLVVNRSNDEQANMVAFSGNPTSMDDDRYLVNAQEGELEVVASDPGILPESVLLTLVDGEVTEILRVSGSTEVEGGEVLTDAELTELAGVLYDASLVFPLDEAVPDGHDIVWDTEWKVDETGQLKIKQIRPYLR